MSRLQGNNQQVFLCSNVTGGKTSITDQVAVNLLLNNTLATGWSGTPVTALNTSNLVISMAANKSLIVSYNQELNANTTSSIPGPVPNINVTVSNASGGDYMYYNSTASDILVQECFSYLSTPSTIQSTTVLVDGGNNYSLSLREAPVDQVSSNGLTYLRSMNITNVLSSGFSINYSAANVTNALGAEGKVFYWNGVTGFAPFYQNITNYVPMSTQNIALSFGNIGDNSYTPGLNGTYDMIQLNWTAPIFNPTASAASSANFTGVVNIVTASPNLTSLTSYPSAGTSYTTFTGSLNYTGLMGNNINKVATSRLVFNLTNYDEDTGLTFAAPLVYRSGYTGLNIAAGYTGIPNFTTVNQMQQPYGNNVTVTYFAGTFMYIDQGQPNPPLLTPQNVTSLVVTAAPTVGIPVPNSDNLTICFNSDYRADVYTNGSANSNQNLTPSIVYQYDFNSSPSFNTSLTANQLTSTIVTYNATSLAQWTRSYNGAPILPINAVTGALMQPVFDGQLGMSLSPENNLTSLYLLNTTISQNTAMVGYINPSGQYNLTLPLSLNTNVLPYLLYNSTWLPSLNGANFCNLSTTSYTNLSGLVMDPNPNQNGKIGYGIINGSIGAEFLSNNAAGNMRFLFLPKTAMSAITFGNPSNAAILTNANVTTVGVGTPQLLWSDNVTQTIAYAPQYITYGPVTYENWPQTYVQSYELIFPEEYELKNGNLRPQAVLVNGVAGLGSDVTVPSNVQKSATLSNYNFSGFCVQQCNSVSVTQTSLLVETKVILAVCLSGMKTNYTDLVTRNVANTVNFQIPVSYYVNINQYGEYTWPGGVKPTLKFWYKFPSTRTHELQFQGIPVTGSQYQNLGAVPPLLNVTVAPPSWDVDLRQSSDILFFRRYNGPLLDYNVNICLYPQTQTSGGAPEIYNVYYNFPVSTSGSADWSGVVANIRGNNARYLQGLSLNNLSGFFSNQSISAQPLVRGVNIFDSLNLNTNTVNVVYNTTVAPGVVQGFNVTIVYPNITQYNGRTYFATMSDHLMSLQSAGGSTSNPPQNFNVTGGNMLFTTRNGPYLLDSGVYVNGSSNYTGNVPGSQAFNVTLRKDNYWAIAYPGQTTMSYNNTGSIPDLVLGNATLVSNALYDNTTLIGSTAGLNTLMVRGFPTTCYGYDRTTSQATAYWGGLSQTIIVDPSAGNSIPLNFDYGLGLNMNFSLFIPSQYAYTFNNVTTAFRVSKTQIYDFTNYTAGGSTRYWASGWNQLNNTGTIFKNMVTYGFDPDPNNITAGGQGDLIRNYNILSQVPWLDLVGLNNIYYQNASGMSVTIAYTQSPIMTSIAPFNCTVQNMTASVYVSTAPFNATASFSDQDLYNNNNVVQRDSAIMTFNPNYLLRNTTGSFYVDIAPIDVRFQWRNTTLGVNNPVGTSTNYALLYNSSSLYNLTADNISCAYLLNAPSLQQFRNSVRTTGASNISGNWNYTPNLVTLKGVQKDGTGAFNVTTIYFTNQNLAAPTTSAGPYNLVWNTTNSFPGVPTPPFGTQYMVSLRQSGTSATSGDEVALVFSNNNLLPTWSNGSYLYNNVSLCVAPDQQVVLNHYDLAWNMNPTTLRLEPTVYKYYAQPTDYNAYGATGSMFNIYDGNSIGYINNVNILNVSQLAVNASFTNVINNLAVRYPYLAIDNTYYPALNSNNVANVSFTGFNYSALFNVTANSDLSYKVVNVTGRDLWQQYFIVPADNFTDAKVVNVFNKDQLVVLGPGNNNNDCPLYMRVGPDGVLYTNDVSAYGYLATNIPSNAYVPYDGVNTQLINANVNLGTL